MENFKNYILNQDITEIKKNLKIKIFDFFYAMISMKNSTSLFELYFFYTIETIQLISFAFSLPNKSLWKISDNINNILSELLSGFRLSPLLNYTNQKIVTIIFFVIFVLILTFFILLIMQILFRKENSSFYNKLLYFTQLIMPLLTIVLYLPINEQILSCFDCKGNSLHGYEEKIECYKGFHLLFIILSIIAVLLCLGYTTLLTYFYFYPFVTAKVTMKLTSSVDIFLLITKLIYIIQNLFITNEYISIAILLLSSLFLIHSQNKEPVYSNYNLELFLNLRNIIILWTYFVLLIAKICYNTKIKGVIYLLIIGYPLVIYSSIMFYNNKNNKFDFDNLDNNNINICIARIRLLVKLIDSFLRENKNNYKNKENHDYKNDLLLKGIIKIHTEICLSEECPLTKFIENKGNYNLQKQCLLNYMANYFKDKIKKFPNNILIRMQYIQFNYDQKYSLNNIKTTLEEIKKIKYDMNYEYILYCQKKEISKIKVKDSNDDNDDEKEKLITEQNYQKLKNLISNSSKLYSEFWAIFAANITNNLNTQKLFKLGEKLNIYLKEINCLWEKNLKNKKLDINNENNAKLYSRFLLEILWDQNKSEAVQKKINEERNIQLYNKALEKNPNQFDNINNFEIQDYIIYISSNEKGKTNIINYSNSLINLIGYKKSELLNKPIEYLMPSIFIDGHSKKIEEYIKNSNSQKNNDNNTFHGKDNKKIFILIRNKMGYLVPFNASFNLIDNNDFTNNFIIKTNLDYRDVKSMYAYYLLTKPDFSLEGISSSSVHLGLSLDLLKKYVIKLNILIRTNGNDNINLYENYQKYINEGEKITWVDPGIIYPKNDNSKLKDIPLQELIYKSNKTTLFLQIYEMKYSENKIIGFIFKLFEKKNVKNKKDIELKKFIPDLNNQIILFDLLNLNYIRAKIVKEKTGFRNLRDKDKDTQISNSSNINIKNSIRNRKKGKIKLSDPNLPQESSEEESVEVAITKDKIFELQTKYSNDIKSFINILPFYGNEISLIKQRPNREKYSTGKAQEPQIKIDLNKFIKLLELKLKEKPNLYKKIKNMRKGKKFNNNVENNNQAEENYIHSNINPNMNKNIGIIEDINRDFKGNASVSFINLINVSSIKLVKIVDFFIYFFLIVITIIQFILSYYYFVRNLKQYSYLNYSYRMLNDISYIKYFVSEGIFLNDIPIYPTLLNTPKSIFLAKIKERLSEFGDELTDLIYQFNNPTIELPSKYAEYTSKTNLTLKTNNEISKTEEHPFFSAINKLTTSLFYLISSDKDEINMENKYAYELMMNLLDSYYKAFQNIIFIMTEFFDEKSKDLKFYNLILFFTSFFVSAVYICLFYRMVVRLEKDREKPLNLFLTIKNKVFEDLKNSAENFSNKLLNKLFRIEENEEESQYNYNRINIENNDINIAKFKALNEYKSLNKKENSFLNYFIQLILVYGIFNIIMLLQYLNNLFLYNGIHNYIEIYDATYISEIYLITRVNIMKQYFYISNCSIFGLDEENEKNKFLNTFLHMDQQLEKTIKETSRTKSFLKNNYKVFFESYFYRDFTELIKDDISAAGIGNEILSNLEEYTNTGLGTIFLKLFEILRYLNIKYLIDPKRNMNKGLSSLMIHAGWFQVHRLLIGIFRPLCKKVDEIICSYYRSFINQKFEQNITIYIILLVVISLYYWIIWKRHEREFIDSIQKSFDLINLMPEEIKNIIINKLNENN